MAQFDMRLGVRVSEDTARRFDRQAGLHDKGRSQMLRELIEAFAEGRARIKLPTEQKLAQETTYEY